MQMNEITKISKIKVLGDGRDANLISIETDQGKFDMFAKELIQILNQYYSFLGHQFNAYQDNGVLIKFKKFK